MATALSQASDAALPGTLTVTAPRAIAPEGVASLKVEKRPMATLLAKQVYQALGMPTDTGPVLSITPDIPVPIKTPAGLFYKVGESLDFRHHILKALIKTCRTLPTHNAGQAPLCGPHRPPGMELGACLH